MQMDDMILVSIDDHMVEPPDMYDRHVPAKYKDEAPKVVRNDEGIDMWVFQGQATSTPFGMTATVGWPREEWGFNPGYFLRGAAGVLRRPRAGARHERQWCARFDVLPDHGRIQCPNVHRRRGQGPLLHHAPGIQRLAYRRVVRCVPWTVHSAGNRADVGCRPRGRRNPATVARRGSGLSASWRLLIRRDGRASCPGIGTRCWRRCATRTWCCASTSGARPT